MIKSFELNTFSEQEIFEKIIIRVFKHYPEAEWLAADKVAITRESPSGNPGPGWTSRLIEHQLIIAPTSGNNEINKYVELERMLSSIVFFHLFYDGSDSAYNQIVSVQKENEKLSKENFKKIHQLIRSVIKNEESYNSVVAMLVYSDLGKAPQARIKVEFQHKDFNKKYADHDDFIDAILNLPPDIIPHIIPSYFSLPKNTKGIISNVASAMKIHLGHVLHIEGGEKMFHKFKEAVDLKKVTSDILDFAFVIQIADVAASTGQVTNKGSLAFTDATCRGYLLVRETLGEIIQGNEPKDALTHYLHKRCQWLNLSTECEEQIILTRLGCMLRYYHPTDGQQLLEYAKKLSSSDWELLKKQFALDDGFNIWKRNPTYLPAVLLNVIKAGGNPIEAAVCVSQLFVQYEEIGLSLSSENPLCLNTLAGMVSREPQLLTLGKFNVLQFTFNEDNNIVKQEYTNSSTQLKV